MIPRGSQPQAGVTLVEVIVAVAIVSILVAVGFSVAAETTRVALWANSDYQVEHEARRSFQRLAEELRMSGRNSNGVDSFPQVSDDGHELRFRILRDLDGDGIPLDASTGETEWDPTVYTVRVDSDGNLQVFDGREPRLFLGRFVTGVKFATFLEDPSLHFREVRIVIETEKDSAWGELVRFEARGSVNMRN